MNLNIKRRIKFNGREYSDVRDLPPQVRAAYEKALLGETAPTDHVTVKKKFLINGQEFDNDASMPADVRRLCEDVMSVIENNGEVTLPQSRAANAFVSKGQWGAILALVGVLVVTGVLLFLHHSG